MTFRAMHWMLAAAMVTGVACNREEPVAEQTTAQQPAERQDDASITTSLQSRFYADDAVRGRDVNVSTQNGVVTLSGTVDSESARERAVALARQVDGVTDVEDQLRVDTAAAAPTGADRPDPGDPGESPTGTTGDIDTAQPGWITMKIQAQYFVNPEVKPWNIDVTTANNGVVTLEGEVDEAADKTEAVRIARETEGVTRVEDRLRVKGEAARESAGTGAATEMEHPDAWLTVKVQSKYFLDDEVKGLDIDVDTNDGVVTLNGSVRSEAERRQALALARTTEGVTDVVDRLQIAAGETDTPATDKTATARETADAERRMDPVHDLSRPDEWITMKIQSKYFLDTDVKGREINVDTVKGVVTLKGSVTTEAEKSQAEQLAKDTEGVTRVVNQLTIGQGADR